MKHNKVHLSDSNSEAIDTNYCCTTIVDSTAAGWNCFWVPFKFLPSSPQLGRISAQDPKGHVNYSITSQFYFHFFLVVLMSAMYFNFFTADSGDSAKNSYIGISYGQLCDDFASLFFLIFFLTKYMKWFSWWSLKNKSVLLDSCKYKLLLTIQYKCKRE